MLTDPITLTYAESIFRERSPMNSRIAIQGAAQQMTAAQKYRASDFCPVVADLGVAVASSIRTS
jgi:hypothetical protein